MKIKQAVILVGGRGSRLKNLTTTIPKPLIEVSGKPFLEYIIWNLSRNGIKEIFLFAGYLGEQFKEKYDNKIIFNSHIKVLIEKEPLGTGGMLLDSLDMLDEDFVVCNGDSYIDFNLFDAEKKFFENGKSLIISKKLDDCSRYGSIKKDIKNNITGFNEKKDSNSSGLINVGTYIFKKNDLPKINKRFISLEEDIFPALVNAKKLGIYNFDKYFIDMGTLQSLEEARKEFIDNISKPILFLDRDGTINHDNGYTHKISDLKILPGVVEGIKEAINNEYYIVCITNQGGIAKEIFTLNEMHKFNDELKNELRKKGANIDMIYYCPHHEEAINVKERNCECRKPKPGMFLTAFRELPTIKEKSFMIGDNNKDIIAANRAGIVGYKLSGFNFHELVKKGLNA